MSFQILYFVQGQVSIDLKKSRLFKSLKLPALWTLYIETLIVVAQVRNFSVDDSGRGKETEITFIIEKMQKYIWSNLW